MPKKGLLETDLIRDIEYEIPRWKFSIENNCPNTLLAQIETFIKEQIYYSGGKIIEDKGKDKDTLE